MGGDSPATKDRKSNEQIEREKMASNEKIAGENLASQQANLDWQKQVQQTEWQREDNTYQRTVSDARAAGVSPLALQGLNDSGEVVPTEAPQNGFRDERRGLQNRQQAFVDKVNAIQAVIGSISGLTSQVQQLYSNKLQNENQALENSFLQSTMSDRVTAASLSNEYHKLENSYLNRTFGKRVSAAAYAAENALVESEVRKLAYNDAARRDRYNAAFGFFDGMSDSEKFHQLAAQKMGFFTPGGTYEGTRWTTQAGNTDYADAEGVGTYNNAAAYATMRLSSEAVKSVVSEAEELLRSFKGGSKVDIHNNDYSDRSHNENYDTKNQWNGFNK